MFGKAATLRARFIDMSHHRSAWRKDSVTPEKKPQKRIIDRYSVENLSPVTPSLGSCRSEQKTEESKTTQFGVPIKCDVCKIEKVCGYCEKCGVNSLLCNNMKCSKYQDTKCDFCNAELHLFN